VTLLHDTTEEADAVFAALHQIDGQILFCYPNADAGSHNLMQRTRSFIEQHKNAHVFVNLPAVTYWSLLRHASLLLGNSSSGIMEAASFALPVVNIGLRQHGRERAHNILDVEPNTRSILEKVATAHSPAFRESLQGMINPYGDGHAAERIVRVLTTTPLQGLLRKRATSQVEPTPPK
jgi:UDP-N-acetylglucosamine 2-epimerase (non-hydrolysing)/GDP/UDP-N,N'-diacetylbacillosamine 2-epimerase (hydrolysing)